MHRSGTSALCAALQACGASFGSHLLDPMEGVNDEGFWEAADVVALNDRLLNQAGAQWFSVTSRHLQFDWTAPEFEEARCEARQIIQRGFGAGPIEVVKDPRLCITLSFWMAVCREMGLHTSVCVINRAPVEVSRSLEKRDGFPVAYSLRLLQTYRLGIVENAPQDTAYVTYDGLLEDPVGVMRLLAEVLPLTVREAELTSAINGEMRHHTGVQEQCLMFQAYSGKIDLKDLESEIARAYPWVQTMSQFAGSLVSRGQELTRIGEAHALALETLDERDADLDKLAREHTIALATLDERDADLDKLAREHTIALATLDERDADLDKLAREHTIALAIISERDKQITEFDQRLAEIGRLHTHALEVISDKDAHLQRVLQKPGIGRVFRAMWKHETR
jgi:hypothetical protein